MRDRPRIAAVVQVIFLPALAVAQEGGTVVWEPVDHSPPAWLEGIFYGALLLYAYGYWRGLRWLVNRYQQHRNWGRVRLLAPVAMLCLSAACFPVGHFSAVLLIVLLAVTFPGFLPALLAVGIFNLEGRAALITGVPLSWAAWYALIRFTEWRLRATCPVSLRIA